VRFVPAPLPILYRDQDVVAVDKPSGLSVHRGWDGNRNVAMTRVRDQLGQHVFPAHRLDRGTSGVLLFALSAEVATALGKIFAEGRAEKTYLALVRGVPPASGTIDHPLPPGEDPRQPRVSAVTDYRRIESFGRYSLVEARPRTGRLHQIRRHLKHIACPIIGDVNYGKGEHNRLFRAEHDLHRMFLHAVTLRLPHPVTDRLLEIHAPMPLELSGVLDSLRRRSNP
jgi:tRNA pseudouridine65 synthase